MSSEALPIRNGSSSNSHDASWGGAPGTSSGAAASWVPGRMSAWCVLTASGACLRSILQKVVKTSSDRPENRKTTWTKGCTAVIFRYQSRPNSSASARTERGGRGEGVFATETAVSGSQSARCEPHRLPPDPRGSFGGSSQPAEARAAGAAGGIRRGPWSVVIFIGTPGVLLNYRFHASTRPSCSRLRRSCSRFTRTPVASEVKQGQRLPGFRGSPCRG